jgi:F-type H+-transporting ATPase subunit b
MTAARAEIDQELNRVKEELRGQVVSIALAGAGKVLEREVDESTHAELLNKLAADI